MNLFESFFDGLEKLEDAGLDVVILCQFYRESDWEDYRWPDEVLEEFFIDRMSQIGPYPGPLRHSFFRRMGILESHLDAIVHEFETLEVPEDPLGFLVSTFKNAAGSLNLSGGSIDAPSNIHDNAPCQENIAALLNARPPSVKLKMQASCSSDHPVYEERDISIFESLPEEVGYLYHTAALESGVQIVENGPFVMFSRVSIDFNGGFYANDDPNESKRWAPRCIKRSVHKTAVTLVYKPQPQFWDQLNIYRPDPAAWSRLVRSFRTNNHSMINIEQYLAYDAVVGPKVQNPTARQVMAKNEAWNPIPYSNQVAFTNPRSAHKLKNYLYAIVVHRS